MVGGRAGREGSIGNGVCIPGLAWPSQQQLIGSLMNPGGFVLPDRIIEEWRYSSIPESGLPEGQALRRDPSGYSFE